MKNKLRLCQRDRLVLHQEDAVKLGLLRACGTGNLGNSSAANRHAKNFSNYWKLNILFFSVPSPSSPAALCPGPDSEHPAHGLELNASQAEPSCMRTGADGVRGGGRKGSGWLARESLQRISCQGKYLVNFHAAGEPGAC